MVASSEGRTEVYKFMSVSCGLTCVLSHCVLIRHYCELILCLLFCVLWKTATIRYSTILCI